MCFFFVRPVWLSSSFVFFDRTSPSSGDTDLLHEPRADAGAFGSLCEWVATFFFGGRTQKKIKK